MMITCPRHNRWTYIARADGTTATRACPECGTVTCPGESGKRGDREVIVYQEKGRLTSVDGWWVVEWDHTDVTGQLTYTLIDQDEGTRYTCRYDDGWRAAPEITPTVDHERLIPNEPDYHEVLLLLEQARGDKSALNGILRLNY